MKKHIITNAKKYVNKLLLPLENHYYHQYEHALDVMFRSLELAKEENILEEEKELLALAGLFHDTGFIISYDNNEVIWAKIAKNYLKSILYPKEKIKIIENLILATDPDYKNPKNILEKIIKDADLDNLWRDDFFEKWDKLKKEIETIKNIKIKDPDWHHASLYFLENHSFMTKAQKKDRSEKKKKNTEKLKNIIKKYDSNNNINIKIL